MTEKAIFTVSELTYAIKCLLEPEFQNVRLQGEISNLKKQSSGHLYFSLKDDQSQISAVMFRGSASKLQAPPKNGDQVEILGELSIYPPRGNYQILVKELKPVGIGALLLKLEELKREIHKRGWFGKELKKSLPTLPRRIGLVTSPTGAAVRDILNVLTRRAGNVHVILNPVRVQGAEAAKEIAQAIDQFNRFQLADVLIVGRGGGSLEDLFAFNEEIVAKAIHESEIPIICAVGHETDHCIAEYVADLRAPTPSAAAELVVAEKSQQKKQVEQLKKRIIERVRSQVRESRLKLEGIARQQVFSSPYALLATAIQRLDLLKNDIDQAMLTQIKEGKQYLISMQRELRSLNPMRQIHHLRQRFQDISRSIDSGWKKSFERWKQRLEKVTATLQALDPKNVLKNGYSILFSEKEKSVIKSVRQLKEGTAVKILLSDGEASASVQEIKENS